MKSRLLRILACPDCGADIRFLEPVDTPQEREIVVGTLQCLGCLRRLPIVDSVPRLFPRSELERRMRKTRAGFGWEWERYPGSMTEEDRRIFLEETQISPGDWQGRLAFDAGCGMGRYTLAALSLGAEVVALDLSDALLRLAPALETGAKLHLVQGDLLHPPIKPGVFDIRSRKMVARQVITGTPSSLEAR